MDMFREVCVMVVRSAVDLGRKDLDLVMSISLASIMCSNL
jgi:hypothetical protein